MRDVMPFLRSHFQEDYQEYGSPVTDWRVRCPFCLDRYGSEDDKYKLHVSLTKETCHCFRCDYTATWTTLVMDLTGVYYYMALGKLYKAPVPSDVNTLSLLYGDKQYVKRERPTNSLTLPKDYISLLTLCSDTKKARHYMMKRGFNDEHFHHYKIGVSPIREPNRVYIPVEHRYYQARAIYPFMAPKYMTPKMESSGVLFNALALEMYPEVVVAEGTLSAMAVGKNAVALLGANVTAEKFERLIDSNVKKFVITIETGKERPMYLFAERLQMRGKQVEIWHYAQDTDPADAAPQRKVRYDMKEHVRFLLTQDTK